MFGYLAIQGNMLTYKMTKTYRNYYCGTCFGIEDHSGQLSRFLLSYDVTLLGIVTGCHKNPLGNCLSCLGKCKGEKRQFDSESWSKIAAMNILLFHEKLKDDMNDDHSLLAWLGKLIFGRKIRQAGQKYPEMEQAITSGYRDMYELEKKNNEIEVIEDRFARMMLETMETCKSLEDWENLYIQCISRWIYYIDALDDYEKDFKKNKFNALKKEDAPTFSEYTKKYLEVIQKNISYVYQNIDALVESIPKDTLEHQILLRMITHTIPMTTGRILSGEKKRKIKTGNIWFERKRRL